MPPRHRNTKIRKEVGTKGQRDKGTRGIFLLLVSPSPCFSFSLSPILPATLFLAMCLCVSVAGVTQTVSFEKQALSLTREMPASDLDDALPAHFFAEWFNKIVGPNAGVVWQLTECGEQIGVPGQPGYDLPACAEINAVLQDGRRVFVAISVGTFKKGLTGKPAFLRAVIEQSEQFHQVDRLRDLPNMLRSSPILSAAGGKNRIADLPALEQESLPIVASFYSFAPMSSHVPPGDKALSQAGESPPPPPRLLVEAPEIAPESVSQSRAIIKVKPAYPQAAKKLNASGTVEVEVMISETGVVIEATAISGHLALRNAAAEAARKWVFEPARRDNTPVKVKSVLTFVFAPSAK
jgi:TonB family protein